MGAERVDQTDHAASFLSGIRGLNDDSIKNACSLANYDVAYRAGPRFYRSDAPVCPDEMTTQNIRMMVERALKYFEDYGPVLVDGFTFQGGYSFDVTTGDGDFLTEKGVWDFKVSKYPPDKNSTLQLLTYYLMGLQSDDAEKYFDRTEFLGIYNPRLDKIWVKDVASLDHETIKEVLFCVIGYDGTKGRGHNPRNGREIKYPPHV